MSQRTYQVQLVAQVPLTGGRRGMVQLDQDLNVDDHTTVNHDLIERWARHRAALTAQEQGLDTDVEADAVQVFRLSWRRVC